MDLRELQKAYLDNLRQVTEEKLEIGSLIRTIISIDEGLVFKDGRKQKPKKLVIIGVDKIKKVCYGSVLVNTKMSPKSVYSASFLSAQYLLHQTDYPEFLKYDRYGHDVAKDIVRETVFNLAVDRSNRIREKSLAQGKKADTVADFMSDIDLPFEGWIPEWGEDHCPYAEVWRTYYEKYPWFREFAPFYCDVIDTTTIENYSKCLSHRITQNVLNEGTACLREYFESDSVKKGEYTYG